jgi:hypothetical protein
MNPKASESDAAKAASGIENGKPRKARPHLEIDLPANAVKQEPVDTKAPETDPPVPESSSRDAELRDLQPRARSPKLLPALLGLVAGTVGGFGAWHVTGLMDGGVGKLTAGLDQRLSRLEQARASSPSDLADRLSRAERGLAEALPREQAERSKTLAALTERSATPIPMATEGASSPRLDDIQAQVNALGPRVSSIHDQVAALARTAGPAAGSDDLSRATAVLVTTGLLGEAFQRQEVLGGILETLRRMGAGEAELAPLMPFATSPPPTPASLLAELRAIPSKKAPEKAEGDFFERLRSGAANLVDIRRTGDITGTDDNAHIARAEQALQRGDIATALTLVGRLTPARVEDFANWRGKAEQRVKAFDAIGKLRAASLERLSRAASATK